MLIHSQCLQAERNLHSWELQTAKMRDTNYGQRGEDDKNMREEEKENEEEEEEKIMINEMRNEEGDGASEESDFDEDTYFSFVSCDNGDE